MNKSTQFLLVFVAILSSHIIYAQDFKFSSSLGPSFDISTPTLGNGVGVEIAYKIKPNIYIGYEYLYSVVSNKTSSYGNPLADGLGYKNQIFGNVLNCKYHFKQWGRYQLFTGAGFLYGREKFNTKMATGNNMASEITGNWTTIGGVPSIGLEYTSIYKLLISATLKGIITENSQTVQLTFGFGISL